MKGILIVGLAMASLAMAQQTSQAPTVAFEKAPKTVKLGQTLKTTVVVTFGEGLHGYPNPPQKDYQLPVEIKLPTKVKDLKIVKVTYPKGVPALSGGDQTLVYEGATKFPIEVALPKKVGKYKLDFEVNYQLCTEDTCFPPGVAKATVNVEVVK